MQKAVAAKSLRMPVTATTFMLAAVAISGIPPLNGFVSEFLIYLGAMHGSDSAQRT
jgi:formate hydrogenlyase subunit 3/multisubunit Na+/H+ antiporter MnhD subunit